MQKTQKKFNGMISGNPIANYIFSFRHPEDIDDFVADLDLAISGNFSRIIDPDYGGGLAKSYWFAHITSDHFELWQEGFSKTIIPLEDWKEILLSWKECLEG